MENLSLAQRLKMVRVYNGLSQKQLAALAGLHNVQLSKLERGITQNISGDTLKALWKATGVSPCYLLGMTDMLTCSCQAGGDGTRDSHAPMEAQPPDTWAAPPPARPATPGWPPVVPPQPLPHAGDKRPW